MVSTALILLAGRYSSQVAIPTCIILAREIAVSALREWMASRGIRNLVQVGYQGKLKTATTMISLTLLLLVPSNGTGFWITIRGCTLFLLYLSTLITVTSACSYFRAAAPQFVVNKKG
jgi:CDP-diacylglycerol---glycerol-3-phosphate 3-phosphatidyltransferase